MILIRVQVELSQSHVRSFVRENSGKRCLRTEMERRREAPPVCSPHSESPVNFNVGDFDHHYNRPLNLSKAMF